MKYTAGLCAGMSELGHQVALLSRDHDLEFGGRPGAMKQFVARTVDGRVRHHVLPGRVRDARYAPEIWRLRGSLRHPRPDVLHFQDTVGNDPRLVLAAGFPWRRFALTVHDPTPHPGDEWPASRSLGLRALISGSGLLFVHSDASRDEVCERYRPGGPIVIVPHGMDPPDVAPLPQKPALLFFGRISTYYKGLDVLLDAMPLIWRSLPDVTLTVAGPGELDEHPCLHDQRVVVRNEHIPDQELPRLFAAATCCVLPYRQATGSGVGAQAKSYGRAIVATAVGGFPELVGPDSGRLVPAEDSAALAHALIEVLATPGLAESMSQAAARWVAEAGWRPVADRTVEAYRRYLIRDCGS